MELTSISTANLRRSSALWPLIAIQNSSKRVSFRITAGNRQVYFSQIPPDFQTLVRPGEVATISTLTPMESEDDESVTWLKVRTVLTSIPEVDSELLSDVEALFLVMRDTGEEGVVKCIRCLPPLSRTIRPQKEVNVCNIALIPTGEVSLQGFQPFRRVATLSLAQSPGLVGHRETTALQVLSSKAYNWIRVGERWDSDDLPVTSKI